MFERLLREPAPTTIALSDRLDEASRGRLLWRLLGTFSGDGATATKRRTVISCALARRAGELREEHTHSLEFVLQKPEVERDCGSWFAIAAARPSAIPRGTVERLLAKLDRRPSFGADAPELPVLLKLVKAHDRREELRRVLKRMVDRSGPEAEAIRTLVDKELPGLLSEPEPTAETDC